MPGKLKLKNIFINFQIDAAGTETSDVYIDGPLC